ncbi:restriction endonuclease subunit S [Mycobacterium riyadhense]|uniref:restriction endonuclease subunit S n=1 Tax=Mycobacterium riyadhense TaxID=486698 RepID=UPI001EF9DC07|nr:restriction endonuclease subunit S [Mycobacterium riyadhense]
MSGAEKVRLSDHLDFSNGSTSPLRGHNGRFPVYGANGVIGYATEHNARGPLIIVGRVGSYCGSLRYCSSDAWVTDNALVCRAKNPEESRYWYYALQTCGLNRYRSGSGQPLLTHSAIRNASTWAVAASERRSVGEILGALDDKIAANNRVIEAAERLMLAVVERVADRTPLSSFARRSTVYLPPREFDDTVAHFSFPAFDGGAQPKLVEGSSIKSNKLVLSEPCVLFPKLNPRIPRVWNVTSLPSEMALASTEFVVLRPVGVDASAVWSAVRQPDVLAVLQQRVAGMTGSRQRIQPDDLLGVPVRDIRRLATGPAQALASLGALCQSRRTESARMARFRDALLPDLTSGRLRLKGVTAMAVSAGYRSSTHQRVPFYHELEYQESTGS